MIYSHLVFGAFLLATIVQGNPKSDDEDYVACSNVEEIPYGVDYIGASGKFEYYECNNTNNKFTTTMNSLIEYEYDNITKTLGDKTTNKETSFAGQNFEWVTNENTTNGTMICNTYQGYLMSYLNFNFKSCLILEYIPEEIDEETEELVHEAYYAGDLKWSVDMGQWDWLSESNKLVLTISLQSSDTDASFESDGVDSDGNYRASLGDLNFHAPDKATIIFGNNQTSSDVDVSCESQTDGKATCTFVFGYYEGWLYYDPLLSFGDDSSNAISYNIIFGFILSCFVAMLF